MRPEPISTALAPAAIGAYSQAVRCGDLVFISGQIPLDPHTMALVGNAAETQIHQVFANLKAVCEAAGGALADICKLTIYLTDLSHFPLVNEAMQSWFDMPFPARAVVEVVGLPKGAGIEADAVVYLPAH